jgi:hypothetical protein
MGNSVFASGPGANHTDAPARAIISNLEHQRALFERIAASLVASKSSNCSSFIVFKPRYEQHN